MLLRSLNFDLKIWLLALKVSLLLAFVYLVLSLHLDVRVQGYPYPWITWSHGDHLLQNKSVKDSETRLKTRNVTVLEGGRYTCYAKNPLGHDILTFDVNVEGIDFICS